MEVMRAISAPGPHEKTPQPATCNLQPLTNASPVGGKVGGEWVVVLKT